MADDWEKWEREIAVGSVDPNDVDDASPAKRPLTERLQDRENWNRPPMYGDGDSHTVDWGV